MAAHEPEREPKFPCCFHCERSNDGVEIAPPCDPPDEHTVPCNERKLGGIGQCQTDSDEIVT